jgi:KaiC/GvpD/RAD55 family RecA-like ATPase
MTRTIPVDIDGLNLLLGGGIPVLKRHEDFRESATLLVRGPPGSGKTILGVQLAGSLARSLGCDVAYGCVELLPSELAAQHAGIKKAEVQERVIMAPFKTQKPRGNECRIFAEMLDIGSSGEEVAKLGDAIEHVLSVINDAGGKPRVLVIDSLSDGYNLGATKAPRELADALCKMAARRGMVLILLEEIVESRPSAWSFATDVVLQLSASEDVAALRLSDSYERRIAVAKNRLGAAEPGVHRYLILPRWGISVLPAPRAYLSKWAPRVVLPDWKNDRQKEQGWSITLPPTWPQFQACVTAVHGFDPVAVRQIANKLGKSTPDRAHPVKSDIFLDFSRDDAPIEPIDMTLGELYKLGLGNPYLSGDELLSAALAAIDYLKTKGQSIRRVLVGDLQSLRSFWNAEGIRHALGVLMAILRRVGIPAILFETAIPRTMITAQGIGSGYEAFPVQQPRIVDFADVVIEVESWPQGGAKMLNVSCARLGLRETLEV